MPLREISREGKSEHCDLADVYGNPYPDRSSDGTYNVCYRRVEQFRTGHARLFFWIHDSWSEHPTIKHIVKNLSQASAFRNTLVMIVTWFSYMLGSVPGTWMDSRWKGRSLYLPVLILLTAIAVDEIQPLSLEEEKDQS